MGKPCLAAQPEGPVLPSRREAAGVALPGRNSLEVFPGLAGEGQGGLGLTRALSLLLPHAQATRRSGGSPGHPAALHQAPAEGAEGPRCRECPSSLCSAPRCCSSPASGALLLTFCSLPLAQVTTLSASSLERLVEGHAEVRMARSAASAVPTSPTWPGADAAGARGPFCCRAAP